MKDPSTLVDNLRVSAAFRESYGPLAHHPDDVASAALLASVLLHAKADLCMHARGTPFKAADTLSEVMAFLNGDRAVTFCRAIGWDVTAVRRSIAAEAGLSTLGEQSLIALPPAMLAAMHAAMRRGHHKGLTMDPSTPPASLDPVLIGIDPGIHGAVAILSADGRRILALHDMPTRRQGKGASASSQMVCPLRLADLLHPYAVAGTMAAIEVAIVKPPSKLVAARTIGLNYGVVLSVLSMLGIGVQEAAPHEWKKRLSLGDDKKESESLALTLWPDARALLTRHDRAEAALIGRAATVGGNVL